MRIVLRIGGSVIATPIDGELIQKYVNILKQVKRQGHNIAAVVGGGALAREFIMVAKDLNLHSRMQDEIAISVSRLFADLFTKTLGEVGSQKTPTTIKTAVNLFKKGKIVVMGGLQPGMTTDTVAALIAGEVKADTFIKATDQEGVYNKDPRKYHDAIRLEHVSFDGLSQIFSQTKHEAGIHQILDPEAIKVMKRLRIKVVVVNGFDPDNVLDAINNKSVGTVIC